MTSNMFRISSFSTCRLGRPLTFESKLYMFSGGLATDTETTAFGGNEPCGRSFEADL